MVEQTWGDAVRLGKGTETVLKLLLFILLSVSAVSFVLVYINTHPLRYPLYIPPSEYKADYEAVFFESQDKVRLSDWLVKPLHPREKNSGIIICHGLGANKSYFTGLAAFLSRRGYVVLPFDFRAHGESGGKRSSFGLHEQKDAAAELEFLSSRPEVDSRRIGIYGFSLGGAVAILTAADKGLFRAVAADSTFTSLEDQTRDAITNFYHLPAFPFLNLAKLAYEIYFQASIEKVSPIDAIGRLSPAPVLIIAGGEDRLISSEKRQDALRSGAGADGALARPRRRARRHYGCCRA